MNSVVNHHDWQAARATLLAEEKAHTRAQDRLAALRRQLPWQRVEKDYLFQGLDGPASLDHLFDGRRQLIIYHHMLKPADPTPCPGCSMVGDQIPHLAHLHARDTSLVFVSRAPINEIEAFRKRMGWSFPWFETADSLNDDFDVTANGHGLNVFFRDQGTVYRTYFATARGVEQLGNVWAFLDLTPLGRQETWEQSPSTVRQSDPLFLVAAA